MSDRLYDVILLDIEGTTTPIVFVKDVLFPFVRNNLRKYLESTINTQQTRDDIRGLIKLAREDIAGGSSQFPEIPEGPVHLDASKDAAEISSSHFASQLAAIEANVNAQMDIDRKIGALKQLQGNMWRVGYESGELLGTVYDDAYDCMKQWHESGARVCIYSSGSVAAQKLIFGYSNRGSMLSMISAHFDTAVGFKQEAKSYANIIEQLNVKPERMLFLTDILGEAKAAREVGAQSYVILREGNTPVDPNCGIEQFSSFHDIPVTSKQ